MPSAALIAGLTTHLNQVNAWLKDKSNLSVHRVEHQAVLREPVQAAESIQKFLNCPLDVVAMAKQVDPSLYRQRASVA